MFISPKPNKAISGVKLPLPIPNIQNLKIMPQMKRFKLIEELQQSMELDIFGKPARVILKNFRTNEIKAMLMTEHNPSGLLLNNLERLLQELIDLECYEYCIPIRDFLHKHT